jgi:hypothetical protein
MRLVPPTTRLYLDDAHAFEADANKGRLNKRLYIRLTPA